jgi:tetratricopeptide (TPR) repeat protein
LWLLGTLASVDGQVEESGRLLAESLDIRKTLGDRITDIVSGPIDLGMPLTWIGRIAVADAVREETLALYEVQGQPEQIALAHVRLATSKLHIGQFEAAEHHARIGLELCRKVDNQRGVGLALWLLALYSNNAGEIDRAESLLHESLAIFLMVEGAAEIGWVYSVFAIVTHRQGRPAAAKHYLFESLRIAFGVFGLTTIQIGICAYLHLLADEGQEERAVEMGALLEKHPLTRTSVGIRLIYAERLAEIRAALPANVVAEAETRGRARDFHETAAEILAELESLTLPERE